MRWGGSYTALCVGLLLPACFSPELLYASEDSGSRLSAETRRNFERSLNELASLAAEQERLLNEAGDELESMRALLNDSRRRRQQLERSLTNMSNEIERLTTSNENSQADLKGLNEALQESENALESLERSWKSYRRSVRIRLWSERLLAASLVIGAFALGLSL